MKEILVVSRVKNNRLLKCILAEDKSVSKFCVYNEIEKNTMYGYLCLSKSPYARHRKENATNVVNLPSSVSHIPTIMAAKIAGILGKEIEWLFPPALYMGMMNPNNNKSRTHHIELSIKEAITLGVRATLPEKELSVEKFAELSLLTDATRTVLSTLDDREAEVIRMSFGLEGREPLSLSESARKIGLSRERVRQIGAKAIAKLRRPWRSRPLSVFVPERSTDAAMRRRK